MMIGRLDAGTGSSSGQAAASSASTGSDASALTTAPSFHAAPDPHVTSERADMSFLCNTRDGSTLPAYAAFERRDWFRTLCLGDRGGAGRPHAGDGMPIDIVGPRRQACVRRH